MTETTSPSPVRTLVTGDISQEIRLYQGDRDEPFSQARLGTRLVQSPGNCELLGKLLEAMVRSENGAPMVVRNGLEESMATRLPACLRSHEIWKPFPLPGGSARVWRLDRAAGYGPRDPLETARPTGFRLEASQASREDNDIVLLDDAGLLFRSHVQKPAWPAFLTSGSRPPRWILAKTLLPLAGNELLRALNGHSDRLVLVVDAEDLRKAEIRITRAVSWERTALDLARELRDNPSLAPLLKCRHLFVRMGHEGVAHIVPDNGRAMRHFTLYFDPERLEGDFDAGIPGTVFGAGSCLSASLARMLAHALHSRKGEEAGLDFPPDALRQALAGGLAAARHLLEMGHGEADWQRDPTMDVAGVAHASRKGLALGKAEVPIDLTNYQEESWTILSCNHSDPEGRPQPLHGPAITVAALGPSTLLDAPKLAFRKLLTVDRAEIESLRNFKSLLNAYRRAPDGPPLSVGVFGAPGSGKSFAVKEVAHGVFGEQVAVLEFNLSQFKGPESLLAAFHQVQDQAIRGTIPLVFWDEFDTDGYRWLHYFLAPMQEGTFQDGQITHPVGKCIFVFAGGLSDSFQTFGPRAGDEQAFQEFKEKKGPDFRSRLAGYLNVMGINPKDDRDTCYPIRRAIVLRRLLGVPDGKLLEMDRGLLNALLMVGQYEHGARSLQKITFLLRHNGKDGAFLRSDLPPRHVVSLHANMDEIEELAARENAFLKLAPLLAPFIHAFYRDLGKKEGWPIKYDMEYDALPDPLKADNIDAAGRIPAIVRLVGLKVVPKQSQSKLAREEARAILARRLEFLAEAEHDGWMESRRRNGWEYRETRDDDLRYHDLLRPYRGLPDHQKAKDRQSVLNYPEIVELAGFALAQEA